MAAGSHGRRGAWLLAVAMLAFDAGAGPYGVGVGRGRGVRRRVALLAVRGSCSGQPAPFERDRLDPAGAGLGHGDRRTRRVLRRLRPQPERPTTGRPVRGGVEHGRVAPVLRAHRGPGAGISACRPAVPAVALGCGRRRLLRAGGAGQRDALGPAAGCAVRVGRALRRAVGVRVLRAGAHRGAAGDDRDLRPGAVRAGAPLPRVQGRRTTPAQVGCVRGRAAAGVDRGRHGRRRRVRRWSWAAH